MQRLEDNIYTSKTRQPILIRKVNRCTPWPESFPVWSMSFSIHTWKPFCRRSIRICSWPKPFVSINRLLPTGTSIPWTWLPFLPISAVLSTDFVGWLSAE